MTKQLLGGTLLGSLLAVNAFAGPLFYSDRSAFQAAASALTTQSFENIPVALPQASLFFPGFTVSETGGINGITSTAVNDFFGTYPVTDGQVAIWFDDNDDSIGVFAFSSTISAFGVDVTTDERSEMTVGGVGSTSFTLGANVPHFFGVIDTSGFNSVTFASSGGPEVGFDFVQFGEGTSAVPEPATLSLVGFGIGAAWFVRRRKTA